MVLKLLTGEVAAVLGESGLVLHVVVHLLVTVGIQPFLGAQKLDFLFLALALEKLVWPLLLL